MCTYRCLAQVFGYSSKNVIPHRTKLFLFLHRLQSHIPLCSTRFDNVMHCTAWRKLVPPMYSCDPFAAVRNDLLSRATSVWNIELNICVKLCALILFLLVQWTSRHPGHASENAKSNIDIIHPQSHEEHIWNVDRFIFIPPRISIEFRVLITLFEYPF